MSSTSLPRSFSGGVKSPRISVKKLYLESLCDYENSMFMITTKINEQDNKEQQYYINKEKTIMYLKHIVDSLVTDKYVDKKELGDKIYGFSLTNLGYIQGINNDWVKSTF